ncbi:MAG: hypothetical protein JNM17_33200 [Archangium sp.]|nr:hypothetical protein [Archangium sp.]
MVAATTLRSKSSALKSAHRDVRLGAKTRVGVSDFVAAPRVGARARRNSEPRWEISARRRESAAEISIHENWNRYYDPVPGAYLQPEPALQDSWWPVEYAYGGHSLPPYSYALNNPLRWVDYTGWNPGDLFSSADEAAADALNYSLNKSDQRHEYGGSIFRTDRGYYSYDEPNRGVTTNSVNTNNCRAATAMSEGSTRIRATSQATRTSAKTTGAWRGSDAFQRGTPVQAFGTSTLHRM